MSWWCWGERSKQQTESGKQDKTASVLDSMQQESQSYAKANAGTSGQQQTGQPQQATSDQDTAKKTEGARQTPSDNDAPVMPASCGEKCELSLYSRNYKNSYLIMWDVGKFSLTLTPGLILFFCPPTWLGAGLFLRLAPPVLTAVTGHILNLLEDVSARKLKTTELLQPLLGSTDDKSSSRSCCCGGKCLCNTLVTLPSSALSGCSIAGVITSAAAPVGGVILSATFSVVLNRVTSIANNRTVRTMGARENTVRRESKEKKECDAESSNHESVGLADSARTSKNNDAGGDSLAIDVNAKRKGAEGGPLTDESAGPGTQGSEAGGDHNPLTGSPEPTAKKTFPTTPKASVVREAPAARL